MEAAVWGLVGKGGGLEKVVGVGMVLMFMVRLFYNR